MCSLYFWFLINPEIHCLKISPLDSQHHCTHTHSLKFYPWFCHSVFLSLCQELSNFLGHCKLCHVCLLKQYYMLLWHHLSLCWLKWLTSWRGFCAAKVKSLSPFFCPVHKISYRSCHMKSKHPLQLQETTYTCLPKNS